MNELNKLHRKWVADLEHFTSVLKRSDVSKKTVDIFVDAFDLMAKCIAQMQNRAMTVYGVRNSFESFLGVKTVGS
jgi:hypothetical protein